MGDTATLTFQTPTAGTSLLPDQIANFNVSQTYNQILSGDYTATPYDSTCRTGVQSQLGLPSQSTQNQTLAQDVQTTQSAGWLGIGGRIPALARWPIRFNNVTGEFYVDETDLQLAGPIPLSVRRNYSSQKLGGQSIWPRLEIQRYALPEHWPGEEAISTPPTWTEPCSSYVQTSTNASVWLAHDRLEPAVGEQHDCRRGRLG